MDKFIPAKPAKKPGDNTVPGQEESVNPFLDKRSWLLALLLALTVLAAFFPILGNEFVNWDDPVNFQANDNYHGLGWQQIKWAWTTDLLGVYQPVSWMILEAQYLLFQMDPWGYHLTSILLYAGNTVVLFYLTIALITRCRPTADGQSPWLLYGSSALAVALFAVHPLRTEVVAWVSCQPYLPCGLFYMLAILAYLRGQSNPFSAHLKWVSLAFGLFTAALLSKAVAVSLPVVLLVLDVYPLGRFKGPRARGWWPSTARVLGEKVPFFALSLVFMAIAVRAKGHVNTVVPLENFSLSERLATACYGLCFYPAKTLWPFGITNFYPLPEAVTFTRPAFFLSALAVAGVSSSFWVLRRRWPALLAAWVVYIAVLAPNLGLVQISSQIAADRYCYTPLMGWTVLLAAALCTLPHNFRRPATTVRTLICTAIALLLGLSFLTWRQCRVWRNSEILWSYALAHNPIQMMEVHAFLGAVLVNEGKLQEGVAQLEEAVRLRPDYAEGHHYLGLALLHQEKYRQAQEQFEEAVRLKPDFFQAHSDLGVALDHLGDLADAMAHLTEAVRLKPEYAAAHNNLGLALAKAGKLKEAAAQVAEALRLNSSFPDAHNSMGFVLVCQGRVAEAIDHFSEALRLRPDLPEAQNNWGSALDQQGKLQEAIGHFQEAVRLKSDYADAQQNLGLSLAKKGSLPEASVHIAEALRLNPALTNAHNSLGFLLARQGKFQLAEEEFATAIRQKPQEADAYSNLGLVLIQEGNFVKAVQEFSTALRLKPDLAAARRGLALALQKQKTPSH